MAAGIRHQQSISYLDALDGLNDVAISPLIVRVVNHTNNSAVIIVRPAPKRGLYQMVSNIHAAMNRTVGEGYITTRLFTGDGWADYQENAEDIYSLIWKEDPSQDDSFRRYFGPSELTTRTVDQIISQYDLHQESAIGVYYRGTDRCTTHVLPPVEEFFAAIDRLPLHKKILVQTDSEHVLKSFLTRYGDRVTFIKELPISSGSKGTHLSNLKGRCMHAVLFNAALTILARSEHLITSGYSNASYYLQQHRRGLATYLIRAPFARWPKAS